MKNFLKEGRIVGHQEGLREGREKGSMDANFKAALSIVNKLHLDFKGALIILDITEPKEQDIYMKKYAVLKNH